jgi:hypothetical protein
LQWLLNPSQMNGDNKIIEDMNLAELSETNHGTETQNK